MPTIAKSPLHLFLGISFLAYGIFLLWSYWGAYPTYGMSLQMGNKFSEHLGFVMEPFLILFGGLLGILFYQRKVLSVAKIVGILWGMIVFLFMIVGGAGVTDVFGDVSILSLLLVMIGTIGLVLIGSVIFTIILIVLGQWFWGQEAKPKEGRSYLLNFFMGFLVLSFVGFFASKLGFFEGWVFVGLLVALAVFQFKRFRALLINIFVQKIKVSGIQLWALAMVLSIMVLNFSQSFFPFSLGWDSHNHYLLTINTLRESGTLRTGIFPPFTEIVLAIFGFFVGLSGVQFLLVFWGSFLPLTFYLVGRRFGISEKINLGLSLVLFLLPAIQFQLSRDLKMDIIYLQCLLVVLAYIHTKRGLLLLGFAPLMKLTALWFWPMAVMGMAWKAFLIEFPKPSLSRGPKVLIFKRIALSLCILLLPFGIWGSMNLLDYGKVPASLDQWQKVLLTGKSDQPVLSIPGEGMVSTAFGEEVGRYVGFEGNFFKKVWAIFTSPNIPSQSKQYVDLGFLWLWIFPFFLWGMWRSWGADRSKLVLALAGLGFFGAWIFVGKGVAWYGVPFLALLFLWSGGVVSRIKGSKILKNIVLIMMVVSVVFGLWGRLAHVSQNHIFTAIAWSMNPTGVHGNRLAKVYYPEEWSVAERLNADLDSRILKVGTMVGFWIKNRDRRVIEDPQLDQWHRLSHGRNVSEVVQILNNNHIKYLLIDRGTVSIETDKSGTLHGKFDDWQAFMDKAEKRGLVEVLFSGERVVLVGVR